MLDREEIKKRFLEYKGEIDGTDFNDVIDFYEVFDEFKDDKSHYVVIAVDDDFDVYVDNVEGKAIVNGDYVRVYDENENKVKTFNFQKEIGQ